MEPAHERIFILGDTCDELSAKVSDAPHVAGDTLAREEDFLFPELQTGGLNFVDLVSEQINFSSRALFVEKEGSFLFLKIHQDAARRGELLAKLFCAAKSVQQIGLLIARKEALMIVGSVKINQQISQGAKQGQGAR